MSVIVNAGSTVDISASGGITLTADSTIEVGGVLQGNGSITGPFTLLNQGTILASSAFNDTLDINVSTLINQGTINAADGTIILPAVVSGPGTIEVALGQTLQTRSSGSYTQKFINNGHIFSPDPTIGGLATIDGQYSGTGDLQILSGASLSGFEIGTAFSGNIGMGGELVLDSPSTFTGTLEVPQNGDKIILKGLVGDGANGPSGGNAAVFTITNSGVPIDTLTFSTDVSVLHSESMSVSVTPDVINNETTLTVNATFRCFCAGTRIATLDSEVLVEELRVGDRLMTHFAEERRIEWIGYRTIDCRRHPNPALVWPIRVAAAAFGPNEPHRDLYLSPDHAVFADGALIPIKYLINEKTIAQIAVESVTYFHIELDEHDVVHAEGLAVESYLETGDRASFANGGPTVILYPEFGARMWDMTGCAPLILAGGEVDRLRARLDERGETLGAPASEPDHARRFARFGGAARSSNGARKCPV